jgi:hypothetical protein
MRLSMGFDLGRYERRCSGMVVIPEPWLTVLKLIMMLVTVCLIVAYVLISRTKK